MSHSAELGRQGSPNGVPSSGSSSQEKNVTGSDSPLLAEPNNSVDRFASRVADWCSPIILKQVRQNVKSRVFVTTFHLLLLVTVLWTAFCYISSASEGMTIDSFFLLCGYAIIFGFPLGVIVPSVAYEGIAASYRDNTQDLLSITTTSPRELVYGIFLSNLIQALTYFGAVFPCIVFCLLLSGIDINSIFVMTSVALLGSMFLTSLSMMLASVSSGPIASMICRLGLILFALYCYALWIAFCYFLVYGFSYVDWSFLPTFVWLYLMAGILTVIFLESTVALGGFVSENRSSILRLLMFLPPFALAAMNLDLLFRESRGPDFQTKYTVFSILAQTIGSHYWLIMGTIACSERHDMSKRVQRTLPISQLKKRFLSLLYPGFGRGYLYTLVVLVGWNISFACLPALGSVLGMWFSFRGFGYDLLFDQQMYLVFSGVMNVSIAGIFLSIMFLLNRIIFVTKGNGRILNSLILLVILYFGYLIATGILFATLEYNTQFTEDDYLPFMWWGAVLSFESRSGMGFNMLPSCYFSAFLYGLLFLLILAFSIRPALGELLVRNPEDPEENKSPNSADAVEKQVAAPE